LGNQEFCCYLFGKRFLVRTDHSAFACLRKFADHNSRLLKLCLKLSELDFEVQHRPGPQISHVDAISRHVGAITHTNSLDKQNVLQEQKAYAFCGTLNPGTYSSRSEFFLNNDRVIYRRQRSGKHQLLISLTLVKDVIRENQENKFVAHPGQKRTYSLISLSYWWPNMRNTIPSFVRECDPY
jgi:hypothetical protein